MRHCQIHPDYLDESIDTQSITITTLLRAKEHTFGAHLCVYVPFSEDLGYVRPWVELTYISHNIIPYK